MKKILFIFSITVMVLWNTAAIGQFSQTDYDRLLKIPRQYTVLKTSEKILIDGKDDERDWSKAPWTPLFADISNGADVDSARKTQCKMLWDENFLYVFARLQETDLWASLTQHDSQVFQDNALEIFIDPGGTNFNYFEFQINAFSTVWDLFLPKPYRNGGKNLTSWDIKGLQKAVHLNGTINNPSDTDKNWAIELAIPFKSLSMSGDQQPGIGTIWRMNFSRVQWHLDTLHGAYFRTRDTATGHLLREHYAVWTPQGIINLHYPERWGYVEFSDTIPPGGFLDEKTEKLKLTLWKYYYLQQEFKRQHGTYAATTQQLDKIYNGISALREYDSKIKMVANEYQFWIQCYIPWLKENLSVDEEGELHVEKGLQ